MVAAVLKVNVIFDAGSLSNFLDACYAAVSAIVPLLLCQPHYKGLLVKPLQGGRHWQEQKANIFPLGLRHGLHLPHSLALTDLQHAFIVGEFPAQLEKKGARKHTCCPPRSGKHRWLRLPGGC